MAENKPLVLVVDDEENFREIFSAKLGAAGFQVETASNGAESIQKAKALKPNLILMDVKMPGMDGVEAFMKLQADPETENFRILFLTNLGDSREELQEVNRRLSKEMGAVGYFKKTDDLDYLVERIKNLVQ